MSLAALVEAQTALRDYLRTALQDVKKLLEEGLVNDIEYTDLKKHELIKYKETLLALGKPPATPQNSPADKNLQVQPVSDPLPAIQFTPTPTRQRSLPYSFHTTAQMQRPPISPASRMATPQSATPGSATPASAARYRQNEPVVLDRNIILRLTTPNIFRRRPLPKRRIMVPAADLLSLNCTQVRPVQRPS